MNNQMIHLMNNHLSTHSYFTATATGDTLFDAGWEIGSLRFEVSGWLPYTEEVVGSSPIPPTILNSPEVVGSAHINHASPIPPTILPPGMGVFVL